MEPGIQFRPVWTSAKDGVRAGGDRLHRSGGGAGPSGRTADSLRGELIQLENNTLLAFKRNDVAQLENKLAALRNENRLHRQSQIVPVEDRRPALEAEVRAQSGICCAAHNWPRTKRT